MSMLVMVFILAEVHPFGAVTAEPITVDIVTSAEVPPPVQKQEPVLEKNPAASAAFELPSKSAPTNPSPTEVAETPAAARAPENAAPSTAPPGALATRAALSSRA